MPSSRGIFPTEAGIEPMSLTCPALVGMFFTSSATWEAQIKNKWKWKLLSLSDSLGPHGLFSPGNSPGQNTGVGSHSVLQGIFPTEGSNPGVLHCRRFFTSWSIRETVHNKCNALESSRNQPPPPAMPCLWVNCLPLNQSLGAKRLGTADLVYNCNHCEVLCISARNWDTKNAVHTSENHYQHVPSLVASTHQHWCTWDLQLRPCQGVLGACRQTREEEARGVETLTAL